MGELIISIPVSPVSVRQHFQTSFPPKTIGPIELKFYMESPKDAGTKVCSNGPVHMSKMAATPTYMVKPH